MTKSGYLVTFLLYLCSMELTKELLEQTKRVVDYMKSKAEDYIHSNVISTVTNVMIENINMTDIGVEFTAHFTALEIRTVQRVTLTYDELLLNQESWKRYNESAKSLFHPVMVQSENQKRLAELTSQLKREGVLL